MVSQGQQIPSDYVGTPDMFPGQPSASHFHIHGGENNPGILTGSAERKEITITTNGERINQESSIIFRNEVAKYDACMDCKLRHDFICCLFHLLITLSNTEPQFSTCKIRQNPETFTEVVSHSECEVLL